MRCLPALALGVLGLADVACAQHGGVARGTVPARAGVAPAGGLANFGAPGYGGAPSSFGRVPPAFSYRTPFAANRFADPRQGYPGAFLSSRPAYPTRAPWSRPGERTGAGLYPRGAGYGAPYVFVEPLVDPCAYGCQNLSPDPSSADATQIPPAGVDDPGPPQAGGAPAYAAGPYSMQPTPYAAGAPEPAYSTPIHAEPGYAASPAPYPGQPAYGGQEMGAAQPSALAPLIASRPAPTPPDDQETITLLFKDGRPPLQIRNYILTRSAVYLTGKHFYEIPLSDIDLGATQRVNWDAGVAFRLP